MEKGVIQKSLPLLDIISSLEFSRPDIDLNFMNYTHSAESTQFLDLFWPPPSCVRAMYTVP